VALQQAPQYGPYRAGIKSGVFKWLANQFIISSGGLAEGNDSWENMQRFYAGLPEFFLQIAA